MAYNYLGIITTEENTTPREGVIAINNNISGDPFLEVYRGGTWIPIDNSDSLDRMARYEDLYSSLYQKDWGIGGRIEVLTDGTGKVYMSLENYDTSVPTIKEGDTKICISEQATDDSRAEFEETYKKLMKIKYMDTEKEIDLGYDYYRYLVSTRNLIDRSSVIDLYSYSENSSDYGNILNLNELLQSRDNLRFLQEQYTIRLEVMYIKSCERRSGVLMFDPYTVDDEGNLKYELFTSSISGDVEVEVKHGCIRVFPEDENVTECIIYHCYAIYEQLL